MCLSLNSPHLSLGQTGAARAGGGALECFPPNPFLTHVAKYGTFRGRGGGPRTPAVGPQPNPTWPPRHPAGPLGGPPEPEASSEVCGPTRRPSRTAASPAGSDSAHAAPATRPNAKPFLLAAAEEPPATLASAAPASLTSQHPGRACPSQASRVEQPRVRQERVHASGLAGSSSRPLCPVGLSASAAHGHLLPQRQDDASRVPPARDRSPGV